MKRLRLFILRLRIDGERGGRGVALNSYASRSQSVIGGSTSSRCAIRMMCAIFDCEARSTRRTCGARSARPRNTQTSRKLLLFGAQCERLQGSRINRPLSVLLMATASRGLPRGLRGSP